MPGSPFLVALTMLAVSAGLTFIRLTKGPTLPDRVIAIDLIGALLVCLLVLMAGLLLAPGLLWLWLAIGALGHSGGFVVIFSALVAVARSDREAAVMSALVQGGGYALGALGGPLIGALHQATGGWAAALVLMLALSIVYTAVLLAAVAASGHAVRRA